MSMNPTHAHFDAEGTISFVFPGGYDEADLVELAAGHWDTPKRWDGSKFVEDVDFARAERWQAVKAKRLAVEQGGCETALGRMDTDTIAQGKVNGAVTMALVAQAAGQPYSVSWTMHDNSTVAHTAPQMIAAGFAVGQHVAQCHAVATALRAQLDAAVTVAEVEAVDVAAAPWPGTPVEAPAQPQAPADPAPSPTPSTGS